MRDFLRSRKRPERGKSMRYTTHARSSPQVARYLDLLLTDPKSDLRHPLFAGPPPNSSAPKPRPAENTKSIAPHTRFHASARARSGFPCAPRNAPRRRVQRLRNGTHQLRCATSQSLGTVRAFASLALPPTIWCHHHLRKSQTPVILTEIYCTVCILGGRELCSGSAAPM